MATHSSILAGKFHGQSLERYSPQACRVGHNWVCAHVHTHPHTHTHTHTHTHRGNPPQPTFIYLEVTVCDGIGCEFKVVLLGDLGPLTLSTRGDCPLCQTLKADTVSREQIKARWRRGPWSTVRNSEERAPLYKGVWATPARVAGKKNRPRLCCPLQSRPGLGRPPQTWAVTPQRSLPCGFCLRCHSGGVSSKP